MKKINLEKLSNEELFSAFEGNRLESTSATNMNGGTSTALCKTSYDFFDTDYQQNQENFKDPRCSSGY